MKIGVPGGLLYYRYHHFIDTFVEELGAERVSSFKSSKKILDKGIEHCVDEACLPIKIFSGHVHELSDKADAIIIPRIMRCEFGESICPKICALPELTQKSAGKTRQIFTEPLYLNDKRRLLKSMRRSGRELGFSDRTVKKAIDRAEEVQNVGERGLYEQDYKLKVFLAGHAYNIHDEFINMGLINKLHRMGVGVITEDALINERLDTSLSQLIKKPYWLYFRRLYTAAAHLIQQKEVDGIIYVSSFNCGIDSIATEMIRKMAVHLPMLVLKLDEQSGEAGFYTRLSAFCDILQGAVTACKTELYDEDYIPALR